MATNNSTIAKIVLTAAIGLGVVGFFFHPYLDADLLAETVDGIIAAGYEFVPSTSVTTGWEMPSSSPP